MSDTTMAVGPVNGSPVDVVMDVDDDGRVVVTVDERPWLPGPRRVAPEVPIGRTDVPWILDRLLTEENAPLRVVLHDGGHTYTDLVGPDLALNGSAGASPVCSGDMSPTTAQPSTEQARSEWQHQSQAPGLPEPKSGHGSTPPVPPDDGSPGNDGNPLGNWFEAGGYTAGERVAVAVIVTRLAADDRGRVGFTIPPALRQAVGDVIAIGEESREIYTSQAGHQFSSQEHFTALLRGETPPSHDNAAGPATGSVAPRPDDPPEMGM